MMEGKLHNLLRVLDAEYDVYIRCLETLTEQQQLLMRDDRSGVRARRCELDMLTRQAAYLESERNKIIENMSGKMNPDAGIKSVRGLLESVKGPRFRRIERLKRTVIEAYEEAERQRRSNESLIRLSLDIMTRTAEYTSDADDNMPMEKRAIPPRRDALVNNSREAVGPILAEKARTGGPAILRAGSDPC